MTRHFVLVTASYVENGKTFTASGIRKLKRGVPIVTFIREYLASIGVYHDDIDIFERDGTRFVKHVQDSAGNRIVNAMSWNFTQFSDDELFTAVSHMTKDELLRDLSELLPLKGMT